MVDRVRALVAELEALAGGFEPGVLGDAADWERLRVHAYWTGRIVERSQGLAGVAPLAASHHERLDGSGYHRSIRRREVDLPAALLAAADVWDAARQDRAHRPALDEPAASRRLLDEADAQRLDPRAVRAVLDAAGQPLLPGSASWPAGLTDRDVDVLRLLAGGRSNKQVARELGISVKTVGRHVEHVHAKAGVSTRGGAVLFAMEHGLTP